MTATEDKDSAISDVAEAAEHQGQAAIWKFEKAQARMQEGVSQAMRFWENSMAFGQNQLVTLVESSKVMAEGLQGISKNLAKSNKENIEQTVAFTQAVIAAKSVKEAAELQAGFLQTALSKGLAQNRETQQAVAELAKEAARRIGEQVAVPGKTDPKT